MFRTYHVGFYLLVVALLNITKICILLCALFVTMCKYDLSKCKNEIESKNVATILIVFFLKIWRTRLKHQLNEVNRKIVWMWSRNNHRKVKLMIWPHHQCPHFQLTMFNNQMVRSWFQRKKLNNVICLIFNFCSLLQMKVICPMIIENKRNWEQFPKHPDKLNWKGKIKWFEMTKASR